VNGVCSGVDYVVGAKTFRCNSCNDCTQAATDCSSAVSSLDGYCSSMTVPTCGT
jgi:hypothetical protein